MIDFIDISTHNLLFLLAFILFLSSLKDKNNEEAYMPISQSGAIINISLSHMVSFYFEDRSQHIER